MVGLRTLAVDRPFPVKITGLGTAFSVHFTEKDDLIDYRDTLEDDTDRLSRFVMEALKEGIYLLPDGRWYVSAVHGEEDIGRDAGQDVTGIPPAMLNSRATPGALGADSEGHSLAPRFCWGRGTEFGRPDRNRSAGGITRKPCP